MEKRSNNEKTILIVEDDEETLSMYEMILKSNQWEIIDSTTNGLTAIQLYQSLRKKPEILLLDINLPGCSGLSVAKEVLRSDPKQKILFLSCNRSELYADPFLKKFRSLGKPFDLSHFLRTLEEIRASSDQ